MTKNNESSEDRHVDLSGTGLRLPVRSFFQTLMAMAIVIVAAFSALGLVIYAADGELSISSIGLCLKAKGGCSTPPPPTPMPSQPISIDRYSSNPTYIEVTRNEPAKVLSASCPFGADPISGGWQSSGGIQVLDSVAFKDQSGVVGWKFQVYTDNTARVKFYGYVYCLRGG